MKGHASKFLVLPLLLIFAYSSMNNLLAGTFSSSVSFPIGTATRTSVGPAYPSSMGSYCDDFQLAKSKCAELFKLYKKLSRKGDEVKAQKVFAEYLKVKKDIAVYKSKLPKQSKQTKCLSKSVFRFLFKSKENYDIEFQYLSKQMKSNPYYFHPPVGYKNLLKYKVQRANNKTSIEILENIGFSNKTSRQFKKLLYMLVEDLEKIQFDLTIKYVFEPMSVLELRSIVK